MKIKIHLNDAEYVIDDSEEICLRMQADEDFAARYISNMVNDPTCSITQSSMDHEAVVLFLEECAKLKDDIRNPKIRRRVVFTNIATVMAKYGYKFSALALEKKLQNMKATYVKILAKHNMNKRTGRGRGRIAWPYMKQMNIIFEEEVPVRRAHTINSFPFILPAPAPALSSSMPNTLKITNTCTEDLENDFEMKSQRKSNEVTRSEILELEQSKLQLGQELLEEIKEMRRIKQANLELARERFEFEKMKYEEEFKRE